MKQEMKVNSYLRGVKIIAIACVIGSVIGGGTGNASFCITVTWNYIEQCLGVAADQKHADSNSGGHFCSDCVAGGNLYAETERNLRVSAGGG